MSCTPHFAAYPPRPHRSGQARIKIAGKTVYLGVFGSPASHDRYNALRKEWAARLTAGPAPVWAGPVRTVADLLGRYWEYAERRFTRADGTVKQHLDNIRRSLRPVELLYGTTAVQEFGPKALKAVRSALVRGHVDPLHGPRKPCCRKQVNGSIDRVRAAWRWAEEEELIPEGLWSRLRSVRGLTPEDVGSEGVYDRPAVRPPKVDHVLAALAELNPVVRAMARVQMLTGARPSELYGLTPGVIVRAGTLDVEADVVLDCGRVWACQPGDHKTAAKGCLRFLLFGPRAQDALTPFLGRDPSLPLFSPREASLPGTRRSRAPRDRYDRHSYHQAVERACGRAGVPHFFPYQLRHLAASLIASEFSPEHARIVLGHRQLKTTRIYVLDDLRKAADALFKVG